MISGTLTSQLAIYCEAAFERTRVTSNCHHQLYVCAIVDARDHGRWNRDLEHDAEIESVLRSEQLAKIKENIAAAKRRRDTIRGLTPEQRKAAEEAARKAFEEAIKKAIGKKKAPKSK